MSIARTWNFVNTLLRIYMSFVVTVLSCILIVFGLFSRKSEINHQFSSVQFSSRCLLDRNTRKPHDHVGMLLEVDVTADLRAT